MTIQFADYCFGVLSAALTNSATTMTVSLGVGSTSPPTLAPGDHFYATLIDAESAASNAVPPIKHEVVSVIQVSGSTWTIVRGDTNVFNLAGALA